MTEQEMLKEISQSLEKSPQIKSIITTQTTADIFDAINIKVTLNDGKVEEYRIAILKFDD